MNKTRHRQWIRAHEINDKVAHKKENHHIDQEAEHSQVLNLQYFFHTNIFICHSFVTSLIQYGVYVNFSSCHFPDKHPLVQGVVMMIIKLNNCQNCKEQCTAILLLCLHNEIFLSLAPLKRKLRTCGGLITAEKLFTPNMPKFEIVKVPP